MVRVAAVVCAVVLIAEAITVATVESAPVPDIKTVLVFRVVLVETVIKSTNGVVGIVSFVSGLVTGATVPAKGPKVSA